PDERWRIPDRRGSSPPWRRRRARASARPRGSASWREYPCREFLSESTLRYHADLSGPILFCEKNYRFFTSLQGRITPRERIAPVFLHGPPTPVPTPRRAHHRVVDRVRPRRAPRDRPLPARARAVVDLPGATGVGRGAAGL